VVAPTASPVTTMPATLTMNHVWDTTGAYTMDFFLQGNPSTSMTDFTINGQYFDMDVMNFTRQPGDVMVWKITNQSMIAHPFHIHGGHFYILSIDSKTPPANLKGGGKMC
jgi:FtsP/CotA-like multicopper oxidase with cupredoxin domain